MMAELAPRHDLEELVESAETPGEREEAVRHLRNSRLALVHRRDDVEVREAAVGDLLFRETRRDDAVDGRALLERRVREDAHEPDAPAAIHEARAGASDRAPDGLRVFGVNGREAGARAAENGEHGAVECHRHFGMMPERPPGLLRSPACAGPCRSMSPMRPFATRCSGTSRRTHVRNGTKRRLSASSRRRRPASRATRSLPGTSPAAPSWSVKTRASSSCTITAASMRGSRWVVTTTAKTTRARPR